MRVVCLWSTGCTPIDLGGMRLDVALRRNTVLHFWQEGAGGGKGLTNFMDSTFPEALLPSPNLVKPCRGRPSDCSTSPSHVCSVPSVYDQLGQFQRHESAAALKQWWTSDEQGP